MTLFLSSELGNRIRGFDPLGPWHPLSPWSLALLAAALALALVGYDRLAGATALVFVATLIADPAWRDLANSRREQMLVPVICFITLGLAPRRGKPNHRRLAWLALTTPLAVASSTSDDPGAAILILALLLLVPPALAMLRTDPRGHHLRDPHGARPRWPRRPRRAVSLRRPTDSHTRCNTDQAPPSTDENLTRRPTDARRACDFTSDARLRA